MFCNAHGRWQHILQVYTLCDLGIAMTNQANWSKHVDQAVGKSNSNDVMDCLQCHLAIKGCTSRAMIGQTSPRTLCTSTDTQYGHKRTGNWAYIMSIEKIYQAY